MKDIVYINLNHGLGDCVMMLSIFYSFYKATGITFNLSGANDYIVSKQKELWNIFQNQFETGVRIVERKDLDSYQIQENGPYNYDWVNNKTGPISEHAISSVCSIIRLADQHLEPVKSNVKLLTIIPFIKKGESKKQVTIQLVGCTNNRVVISLESIKKIIYQDVYKHINFFCLDIEQDAKQTQAFPHDLPCARKDHSWSLLRMFEEINDSCCHIGICSGLSYIALSCGTPLILLGSKQNSTVKRLDTYFGQPVYCSEQLNDYLFPLINRPTKNYISATPIWFDTPWIDKFHFLNPLHNYLDA